MITSYYCVVLRVKFVVSPHLELNYNLTKVNGVLERESTVCTAHFTYHLIPFFLGFHITMYRTE